MTQQFQSANHTDSSTAGTEYPALHESLQQLISTFEEMEQLIHQQLRAVVENDFDEIVAFAEKQLELTYLLNQREQSFQRLISQVFHDLKLQSPSPSLSVILDQVDQMREEFGPLRERLLSVISSTQKAQQQLVNLLEFAQDHVSHTLREIYALSNQHNMHYTNNGHKSQSAGLARMINQTA